MNNSDEYGETISTLAEFSLIDYAIIITLLCLSLAIGIFIAFYRDGCRTVDDFLFGNYKMTSIPVALSLLARWLCGIITTKKKTIVKIKIMVNNWLIWTHYSYFVNSINLNINSKLKKWFYLQSIVADRNFNHARGNLFVWMAIHNVYSGVNSCYASAMLHFFTDFI